MHSRNQRRKMNAYPQSDVQPHLFGWISLVSLNIGPNPQIVKKFFLRTVKTHQARRIWGVSSPTIEYLRTVYKVNPNSEMIPAYPKKKGNLNYLDLESRLFNIFQDTSFLDQTCVSAIVNMCLDHWNCWGVADLEFECIGCLLMEHDWLWWLRPQLLCDQIRYGWEKGWNAYYEASDPPQPQTVRFACSMRDAMQRQVLNLQSAFLLLSLSCIIVSLLLKNL